MPEATRVIVAGSASGKVLALDEPLSFWGGFDSETGTITDRAHPQLGACLAARIVTMTVGRGSSSASTVLAESIRRGTAPAALVMLEPDEIVALGAIVAEELYGLVLPIVLVDETTYELVSAADSATIDPSGTITAIS